LGIGLNVRLRARISVNLGVSAAGIPRQRNPDGLARSIAPVDAETAG
jgi:hypothetical protein